jgi:hypothetical protein
VMRGRTGPVERARVEVEVRVRLVVDMRVVESMIVWFGFGGWWGVGRAEVLIIILVLYCQ